jgi:beta-alanine degradation protein BauB
MTIPQDEAAFADWPTELVEELRHAESNCRVGSTLVSETDDYRVWHLSIAPGERLPFHCHVLDYFWTALSNGRSLSRYEDASIRESTYESGTTKHFHFAYGERMIHDLENIGETTLTFVTVESKRSENRPLPLS